jgi:hypothetical protein
MPRYPGTLPLDDPVVVALGLYVQSILRGDQPLLIEGLIADVLLEVEDRFLEHPRIQPAAQSAALARDRRINILHAAARTVLAMELPADRKTEIREAIAKIRGRIPAN